MLIDCITGLKTGFSMVVNRLAGCSTDLFAYTYVLFICLIVYWTEKMSDDTNGDEAYEQEEAPPSRPAPRLNERILSSMSRRSVAAHPWHDLEIGN